MASAVIAMTSISICLTKGKVPVCKGLAYANCLARLATNFEWLSSAYLCPDFFPFKVYFSEASPMLIGAIL